MSSFMYVMLLQGILRGIFFNFFRPSTYLNVHREPFPCLGYVSSYGALPVLHVHYQCRAAAFVRSHSCPNETGLFRQQLDDLPFCTQYL